MFVSQAKNCPVKPVFGYKGHKRREKFENVANALSQGVIELFSITLSHAALARNYKRLVPPRYNELIGLQHMKIYVFDNSVIISGANLSNDYFTNRQDRYALIEDKPLTDFHSGLVSVVQRFSLCVNKNSESGLHKNWQLSPYEGTKREFITEAKEHVRNYFVNVIETQKLAVAQNTDADTWVFPSIEMGQLGIHHDSLITKKKNYSLLPLRARSLIWQPATST